VRSGKSQSVRQCSMVGGEVQAAYKWSAAGVWCKACGMAGRKVLPPPAYRAQKMQNVGRAAVCRKRRPEKRWKQCAAKELRGAAGERQNCRHPAAKGRAREVAVTRQTGSLREMRVECNVNWGTAWKPAVRR